MKKNNNMIIIMIVIIAILIIAMFAGIIWIIVSNERNKNARIVVNNTNENTASQENETPNGSNNPTSADETIKIQEFNSQFIKYEGTEKKSTDVEELISMVIINNRNHNDHQVLVSTAGEGFTENIQFTEATNNIIELSEINGNIKANKEYSIQLEYDDIGYVYIINIQTGESIVDTQAIDTFNAQFEAYSNKIISGEQLSALISIMRESNKQNAEHQVRLYSEDITSIQDINPTDMFLITSTTDEEGYINGINATKQ